MAEIDLLHLDNHLLVVNKPAGLLIQGDKTGDPTLFEQVTGYLKKRFNKPGNVYLGLVHRLDRPVSGVVVFARTSKAAARLSEQFRVKTVEKTYRALVQGRIAETGLLEDRVLRKGTGSIIADSNSGKPAVLSYRRLRHKKGLSLVEIKLATGRHHQIRVQLAHSGFPVLGDFRYGSKTPFPFKSIALHAHSLCLTHPVTKKRMRFAAGPGIKWPFY